MGRFRATPYARALYEVVLDQCHQRVEEVVGELESLAAALHSVADFDRVLVTPMVAVETKTAILDQVLDLLGIVEPTRRFAHVVQRHYRMQHMPRIVDMYRELVDRGLGRTRASVAVPVELDEAQKGQLIGVLEAAVGSTVVADFVANPELLAGFRVQIGSKVFDGSLVGQLKQLSRQTRFE